MSYCRFSEGDVYLVQALDEEWCCYWCKLDASERNVTLTSIGMVVEHLEAHVDAGHQVPTRALIRASCEKLASLGSQSDSPGEEAPESPQDTREFPDVDSLVGPPTDRTPTKEELEAALNTPCDELLLTVRSRYALRKAGIRTLRDLAMAFQKPLPPGFGRHMTADLKTYLESWGLAPEADNRREAEKDDRPASEV